MPLQGSFGFGFLAVLAGFAPLLIGLAVGAWAGLNGGRALWLAPVLGAFGSVVGLALGYFDVVLPYLGSVLAVAALLLGILIALAVRVPVWLVTAVCAVALGLAGMAAAGQARGAATPLLYWTGYGLGVLALAAAGLGFASMLAQAASNRAVRVAGGVIGLAGLLRLLDIL